MSVIRYVGTYINRDGVRTLMTAQQGQYTYATAAEAQAWIEAVTRNNSADLRQSVWGEDPRFEVRPCECYDGYFDPIGIYFDTEEFLASFKIR